MWTQFPCLPISLIVLKLITDTLSVIRFLSTSISGVRYLVYYPYLTSLGSLVFGNLYVNSSTHYLRLIYTCTTAFSSYEGIRLYFG